MIRTVIVGGDSPRSLSLHEDLLAAGLFQVEIQPRIVEEDLNDKRLHLKSSKESYGRELSIAERCCALAHRRAQERIVSSGGIILEDDAVVLNFQLLADYASWVVESNKSILLNLSSTQCAEDVNWEFDRNKIIRTCGPSALAVGYVASSQGMCQLIESNQSLQFVADWPPLKAIHYRLKFPVVAHGQRNFESLIAGSTRREAVPLIALLFKFRFRAFLVRLKGKLSFEITRIQIVRYGAKL